MIEKMLNTTELIPTDEPRRLKSILETVRLFAQGNQDKIEPIVVLPSGEGAYFVCSGNHRSAAAHICGVQIKARVIENEMDRSLITEGYVAKTASLHGLLAACKKQAMDRRYLSNRWEGYLTDVAEFPIPYD